MVDPRITMEEAGKGMMLFGNMLRNTEGGRRLMVEIQLAIFLREWDCDRPLWMRIRDRIIDFLIDHLLPS